MNEFRHSIPPPFTYQTVFRVLKKYASFETENIDILPMPQGFGGRIVHTRCGDQDLVIKQLVFFRPRDQMLFALRFHDRFSETGVPCPKLHRTSSGDLCAIVDDQSFSVQDWRPGTHFNAGQADSETRRRYRIMVGKLLAHMHATVPFELINSAPKSSSFTARELLRSILPIENVLRWNRGGKLARNMWITLHESRDFARDLRRAVKLLNACREELSRSDVLSDPRLSVVLPVHGDLDFENLLFESGKITAVIDFDNASVCPQAYDLGSTMTVVCDRGEHRDDFLQAYAAIAGDRMIDRKLLRECVLLRALKSLTYQISIYTSRTSQQPELALLFMRQLIDTLEIELSSA